MLLLLGVDRGKGTCEYIGEVLQREITMVNHDDGSVRVVVRIRPANDAERGHGYKTAVTSSEDSCNSVNVTNSNESFSFDAVANESTTQADIFNMVGRGKSDC